VISKLEGGTRPTTVSRFGSFPSFALTAPVAAIVAAVATPIL